MTLRLEHIALISLYSSSILSFVVFICLTKNLYSSVVTFVKLISGCYINANEILFLNLHMLKKIIEDINSFADSNKARILSRFFKTGKGEYGEGDIFIGVSIPQLRSIAKTNRDIDLSIVKELLKRKEHEIRMCALLILTYKYKKESEDGKQDIFELYINNTKYINNWDLVDVTAPNIVGEFLKDKDRSILYTLAKSNNLWERRISIISTFTFIRNNDLNDTLNISTILLQDPHDLIHKAVGWMLREVYKRDKDIIIEFLDKNIDVMPRVMLRYAIEKMGKEERDLYLNRRNKKSKLYLL